MNTEQIKQFDSIFNALSESLDITETQYEAGFAVIGPLASGWQRRTLLWPPITRSSEPKDHLCWAR